MRDIKFYIFSGIILLFIGLLVASVVYVVNLKNQINNLTQQNLIQSKILQEQEQSLLIYQRQNITLRKTITKLSQQKQQDIKELAEIDKIEISENKQEELFNSLKFNGL